MFIALVVRTKRGPPNNGTGQLGTTLIVAHEHHPPECLSNISVLALKMFITFFQLKKKV